MGVCQAWGWCLPRGLCVRAGRATRALALTGRQAGARPRVRSRTRCVACMVRRLPPTHTACAPERRKPCKREKERRVELTRTQVTSEDQKEEREEGRELREVSDKIIVKRREAWLDETRRGTKRARASRSLAPRLDGRSLTSSLCSIKAQAFRHLVKVKRMRELSLEGGSSLP